MPNTRNDRARTPVMTALVAVVMLSSVARAQGPRRGHVLVANQQSANASLIDLATDSMRFIDVGVGPHEAVIAPSGTVGVVTIYGTQTPGNELAIIDIKAGTLKRKISLGAVHASARRACSCRATSRAWS